MRPLYRFLRRVVPLAVLMLLLAGAVPLGEAFAQSRGGTASDTTRTRGRTTRTAPTRTPQKTERATPQRTERSTPQRSERSRTERTTPQRTERSRTERSTPPTRTERSRTERSNPPTRNERSRTERTTPPTRTERSTRTQRTTPSRTERSNGTARTARRGTLESGNSAEERRQEALRRAEIERRNDRRDDRYDRWDDRRDDRRDRRRYQRNWYRPAPAFRAAPRIVVRPGIYINIDWPWEHRHSRRWAPHYRYRQVVHYEAGWRGSRRNGQLDVRTRYHQRVRRATATRAEVDIYIDAVELYDRGRFIGEVDRIPDRLGRLRAVIYRDGRVRFDRDVFLVGDPYVGFEMISTPFYDGYVLDAYERGHDLRVGRLDLRRERVQNARYSRLFDPYDFAGYVPVPLLPEDGGWLFDYGRDAISSRYYDDGYGGYGDDRYGGYGGDRYGDDGYFYGFESRSGAESGALPPSRSGGEGPVLRSDDDAVYESVRGGEIRLRREAELERVQ